MALLRDGHPSDTGCDLELYATRDIREGEELAMDYSFAMGDHGWVEMGLSSWEVLGYPDEYSEEEQYDEEEEPETEF
jgi:SET domain-containing protein